MVNNWLRVNKAHCWLPSAIPSTTNLNQGVEDCPSSNLVFGTPGESNPEIFKGLQSTRFIHLYGMFNNCLTVNKAPCWLQWAIPRITNVNQGGKDWPNSDLVKGTRAKTFEKPSRVSTALVSCIYLAHLIIKVEWTRLLVHYHEQFLGLSKLKKGIEDLSSSNMACTMSS